MNSLLRILKFRKVPLWWWGRIMLRNYTWLEWTGTDDHVTPLIPSSLCPSSKSCWKPWPKLSRQIVWKLQAEHSIGFPHAFQSPGGKFTFESKCGSDPCWKCGHKFKWKWSMLKQYGKHQTCEEGSSAKPTGSSPLCRAFKEKPFKGRGVEETEELQAYQVVDWGLCNKNFFFMGPGYWIKDISASKQHLCTIHIDAVAVH